MSSNSRTEQIDKLSKNTFLKYFHLTTNKVEQEVENVLPIMLALTIDGWRENSSHFVCIMARFLNSTTCCQTILLPFSPMADQTTQGAEKMSEFVKLRIVQYVKSPKNSISITADKCETKKCLSYICQVSFVDCHSHRFALAVKEFVKKVEVLIEKVNTMLTNLKSPVMSAALRKSIPYRRVKYVLIRWLSTMDMFFRYLNIKELLIIRPKWYRSCFRYQKIKE